MCTKTYLKKTGGKSKKTLTNPFQGVQKTKFLTIIFSVAKSVIMKANKDSQEKTE